jgi:hypothetical protein
VRPLVDHIAAPPHMAALAVPVDDAAALLSLVAFVFAGIDTGRR